ncbi:MAG: Do family serine endopeptidase [Psychrosphaera sp.]|nr:Do family serine endopeptidase [Psychrosphaera sp.]
MKINTTFLASFALSVSLLLAPAATANIPAQMMNQAMPSLAPMLELVTPGVVSISVFGSKTVQHPGPSALRDFFGRRSPRQPTEQPFQGLGSGVIIDAENGYIVTNSHVVEGADDIRITLKDGREFTAKKVGGDKESDIALLKIEAKNLVAVKLADANLLRVGDFAVAIGNPFGLSQTVTSGIISALGRAGLNIEGYEDFIQTDAAINSGNSGGALINLKGELIGINTAIYAPGGGNVGIAFSIPSNMMKSVVSQILDYGEVRRGVLGIVGRAVSSGLAESMGLSVSQGAFVQRVIEDSAAAEAKLEAGDVIVSINGVNLKTFDELAGKIATLGAGTEVILGVLREEVRQDVVVKLKSANVTSNIKAESLMPQLAGANLSDGKTRDNRNGVVVSDVNERSPAGQLGLENGDVIMGVNRKLVNNIEGLRTLLGEARNVIVLNIRRGRTSLYLMLQ